MVRWSQNKSATTYRQKVIFAMLNRFGSAAVLFGPALISLSFTNAAAAAATSPGAPARQMAQFAVNLPLRNRAELDVLRDQLQDPQSPRYHAFLSNEEFARRFGPTADAKAAVARELRAAGFSVRIGSQSVFARGTEPLAERYFHTSFGFRSPDGLSRAQLIPAKPLERSSLVTSLGAHIVGLDGVPEWHSDTVVSRAPGHDPKNDISELGPYGPGGLKQAYSYPSYKVATGAGTYVGIISGSPVATSDVDAMVKAYGYYTPSHTYPSVYEEPIDGGGTYNASGGVTGEATLDVEQINGSAPGAGIVVFDVPALVSGEILEAYDLALISGVDIMSSSVGQCEKAYDTQIGVWELEALDDVFYEGAVEGVTYVGASGDNAAFMCGTGTASANLSVIAPANDPFVVGVGGTTRLYTVDVKNSTDSAYLRETSYPVAFSGHGGSYWGSGGGYSIFWDRPSYQSGFVTGKFRGVPDVAMHMGAPVNGYSLDYEVVGGKVQEVAGTSAAAPEFAGLLALRIQVTKKRLGDVHPALYALAKKAGAFRTGIVGNNAYYNYSKGLWDPVLGLGTPYGRVIAGDPTAPLAGDLGTSSNP